MPWSRPFDDPIKPPKGRPIVTLKDAAAGLLLAHQLLVEQLAREGSLDRKRYVSDLKLAYNSLTGHHADSDGAKLLHTMARQFEHGPKKKKKKT